MPQAAGTSPIDETGFADELRTPFAVLPLVELSLVGSDCYVAPGPRINDANGRRVERTTEIGGHP